MFHDFHRQTDPTRRRRTMVSTLVSLVVYGAIGGVVAVYASSRVEKPVEEDAIDVTFQAAPEPAPVKPEPAPPPPPASAAPPPPPEMKVRKVKPPAADPMKPPDAIPEAKPEEGDPNAGIAVVDTGGDPGGTNTGTAKEVPPAPPAPPPPPPRPKASLPINLPENGVPAQPKEGNAAPEYPAKQRSEGVEGLVVLKIVIKDDGSVGDIQVMKGDEPFVSAARAAVKTWRFTPAMLDGQPIATFKIIKVPFTSTR